MANEKVISLEVGQLQANCYIVFAENSTPAFVIDPGADAPRIAAVLRENSLECCMIVLTHGHYDHIGGVNELLSFFPDARLAVHKDEAEMLSQPTLNLSWFFNDKIRIDAPAVLLDDGAVLECGRMKAQVISVAGHTKGGICLYFEGMPGSLFSGDSLFQRSIGRTDFPGGSLNSLVADIRNKLFLLPDDTIVFPGHGPRTAIGDEKSSNPYVSLDDPVV